MDTLNDKDWKTILAICDTFVPAVDKAVVQKNANPDFDATKAGELAQLKPSNLPGFRECLENTMSHAPKDNIGALITVIKQLGKRSAGLLLTGSWTVFTDMKTQKEREAVLMSWHTAMLGPLRGLYRSLYDLSAITFTRVNKLGYEAIGHPGTVKTIQFVDGITPVDLGDSTQVTTDVVVVGSGAGAGVVAHQLVSEGYKVIIIEKGEYYENGTWTEDQAQSALYDNHAVLMTEDRAVTVVTASNVGGGNSVSWSACVETPETVRKEWGEQAPMYCQEEYDESMQHVLESMGCVDATEHSSAAQLLRDGCEHLAFKHSEVKLGDTTSWLKDAVSKGCEVMSESAVSKIIHKNGHATAVEVVKGKKTITVACKQVVVAAGTLQTPGVLQRSKFIHKGIGNNVKLHPMTTVFGSFDEVVDANDGNKPVSSVMCYQFAERGDGYGAMVHAMPKQALQLAHFMPWRSGEDLRKDMLQLGKMAVYSSTSRDKDSVGKVTYTKDQPFIPQVDYTLGKYDLESMLGGVLGACDVLYIQGAKRIITPLSQIEVFETSKPQKDRQIDDPKYVAWRQKVADSTIKPIHVPMASSNQLGTCRMGNDEDSPVDVHGMLKECNGVYVADGSVLPGAPGVFPMATIMATANIISNHVIEALKGE